jgi:hypothetical protein
MKVTLLFVILLLAQMAVISQTLPEWFRVYTLEDSIVELNTNYVMFSNRKIERVRFRWTYQEPQTLDKDSELKYLSILQEIQVDCQNRIFRIYDLQWFDEKGKLIVRDHKKETDKWMAVKFSVIMGKLFPQACKLIDLRRREPAIEK